MTTTRSLGPTQAERFVYTTTEDVAARPVLARILAAGLRQCRTDNDTSDAAHRRLHQLKSLAAEAFNAVLDAALAS